MPISSGSHTESRSGRGLLKAPWRSLFVRPVKCAMLRFPRSSNIFRSCSAGRDKASTPAGEVPDMGTIKAIVGVLVVVGVFYALFQVIPPELANYSFQDDLKNIAM